MTPIVAATAHHFGAGVYAKEMHLPKGYHATTHKHAYDHLSILAQGKAWVTAGGTAKLYTAPAVVTIEAGVAHGIEAVEDAVWYCIHPADQEDPQHIDDVAILK